MGLDREPDHEHAGQSHCEKALTTDGPLLKVSLPGKYHPSTNLLPQLTLMMWVGLPGGAGAPSTVRGIGWNHCPPSPPPGNPSRRGLAAWDQFRSVGSDEWNRRPEDVNQAQVKTRKSGHNIGAHAPISTQQSWALRGSSHTAGAGWDGAIKHGRSELKWSKMMSKYCRAVRDEVGVVTAFPELARPRSGKASQLSALRTWIERGIGFAHTDVHPLSTQQAQPTARVGRCGTEQRVRNGPQIISLFRDFVRSPHLRPVLQLGVVEVGGRCHRLDRLVCAVCSAVHSACIRPAARTRTRRRSCRRGVGVGGTDIVDDYGVAAVDPWSHGQAAVLSRHANRRLRGMPRANQHLMSIGQ